MGVEVKLQAFLNSVLNGVELSTSHTDPSTPGEGKEPPVPVGFDAGWASSCRKWNPEFSVVQPTE
jgi:hypothetical protein